MTTICSTSPPGVGIFRQEWWAGRSFIVAMILLSAIPLVWPAIPPVTDLAGHMGRYRIELDQDKSIFLRQWYDFHWAVVGNLGVDLLIVPLAKIFGLELATKLIVAAIPPLTVAGLLMVALEAHGRLPPTAAFALPLAYGAPFQFGFVNFALAMALAMILFGLWLRLGRQGHYRRRIWLFLLVSPLLWIVHAFGWGVLGLLVFTGALGEARRAGATFAGAIKHALWSCLPLSSPLLIYAYEYGTFVEGGKTLGFLVWRAKLVHVLSILRNENRAFDIGSAFIVYLVVLWGLFDRRVRIESTLGMAALVLLAAFLFLPEVLLGSAFAAMRLAPYVAAFAVLALAPRLSGRAAHIMAALACIFFVTRIAAHTIHYAALDRAWTEQLVALDHVPRGSRIFAMADVPCLGDWGARRMENLGAFGIVRREAFVNGQWELPGAQLLTVRYPAAPAFAADPTQILMPRQCRQRGSYGLAEALRLLPRPAFDYLWLIDLPRDRWPHDAGLIPVWEGARGVLYKFSLERRPTVTSAQ